MEGPNASAAGLYDDYAAMAAGSPWSDAWDWATGKVGDLYNTVYNWVSDNVSRAPIGLFSTLASVAPYAMSGVRFNVPKGIDGDVLALLSGSQWNGTSITYSLPDSRLDYQWSNPSANGYRPLAFDTEQAVRYALEGYSPYHGGPKMGLSSVEGVTNLSLSYAGRNGGTLQIAGFNPNSVINRSHGYYPGVPIYGGDVWLESKAGLPGTYSYMVVLHELGHSLGLKHPHDSGGSLPTMSSVHDSPEYTVMSYGYLWDKPQTFMQYDIAALQVLYGADFVTNSGNSVYTWSPETGEAFVNGIRQGAPVTNKIFMTIWDGGGNDTYDLSNYSGDQTIDLAPGGYSKFSQTQLGMKTSKTFVNGNVYNAFQYRGDPRSLIENANGGSGNDSIKGNVADNVLNGNGGADALTGGEGNDRLNGGSGSDSLNGGAGADVLSGGADTDMLNGGGGADVLDGGDGYDGVTFAGATSGVTVDLVTNQHGGYAAGVTIVNVESVQATNFADRLVARERGNGLGTDLHADGGNDTLIGSAGQEGLFGGEGDDWFDGRDGADTIHGWTGHDAVHGGDGNDSIYGGAGNDWLSGGDGADLLDGGADWDTVSYLGATSGVTVDLTGNANGGAAAGDVISGVEVLQGSNFDDRLTGIDRGNGQGVQLYGEGGSDWLYGKNGGDCLFGGAGNDWLDGGFGGDILNGGAGADQFKFSSALGGGNVDTIQDFSVVDGDRIVLSRTVFMDIGSGTLSSVYFSAGPVTSFDHHILYDQSTGGLFYDVDGSGGVAAIKFAAVTAGTALNASHFLVV
ncbi:M10 family metallopeptidase C-terminal domain-containing protein [Microvirga sp. CF3016]|uniref:M10 family metallopeptidase C-terminal domain-containing protein n=1 Tax=Microvirga sp. CF3016 TaxID=3110181 RepID=UPI002E75EBED|nr:M10 family metallopeptidase C-terminal domain-containing protein [Microvirga sp. CF3016]MEE1611970.1 M10 family metallopeptidase C-terminal domain-containing protein [Microvirga sp. CF3016]